MVARSSVVLEVLCPCQQMVSAISALSKLSSRNVQKIPSFCVKYKAVTSTTDAVIDAIRVDQEALDKATSL